MHASRPPRRARREPNRLHRRTERLEDLLSWSLGVLLVVAGWVALQTGGWVHDTAAERARLQAAERAPVTAVVVEAVSPVAGVSQSGESLASVRWSGSDGMEHVDRTIVQGVHSAGETVPAWVNRSGHMVPAPITATDATAAAVEIGILVGVAGAGVVFLLGLGASAWTARRYALAWEQEWAQVGPEWSRRATS